MELSPKKRAVVVALSKSGIKQTEIAAEVGVIQSCVSKLLRNFRDTGTPTKRQRSGRPKKTTCQTDRQIARQSLRNRQPTSTDIRNQLSLPVSSRTVRRRLVKAGLVARRPRKKPLLTESMRKARLQWAKDHADKSLEFWRSVIFSDESRFNVGRNDAVQYVRRRSNEVYRKECLVPTFKHPEAIMIWGCFSWLGIGRLKLIEGTMNAKGYIEVLEDRLLGTVRDQFEGDVNACIFQDDSAPCHRARSVSISLQQLQIISELTTADIFPIICNIIFS